eukprot:5736581-Prymnesium_polylepis.1
MRGGGRRARAPEQAPPPPQTASRGQPPRPPNAPAALAPPWPTVRSAAARDLDGSAPERRRSAHRTRPPAPARGDSGRGREQRSCLSAARSKPFLVCARNGLQARLAGGREGLDGPCRCRAVPCCCRAVPCRAVQCRCRCRAVPLPCRAVPCRCRCRCRAACASVATSLARLARPRAVSSLVERSEPVAPRRVPRPHGRRARLPTARGARPASAVALRLLPARTARAALEAATKALAVGRVFAARATAHEAFGRPQQLPPHVRWLGGVNVADAHLGARRDRLRAG